MKDRHAPRGFAALRPTILGLPRETKRFIMAAADAVAIPTALWAALVLKFDTLNPVRRPHLRLLRGGRDIGAYSSFRCSVFTAR